MVLNAVTQVFSDTSFPYYGLTGPTNITSNKRWAQHKVFPVIDDGLCEAPLANTVKTSSRAWTNVRTFTLPILKVFILHIGK